MISSYNTSKEQLKHCILNRVTHWGEGKQSDNKAYQWVLDTKEMILDQEMIHLLSDLLIEKIAPYNPQAIGGVTLASHLLTSALVQSEKNASEFNGFFVRRERKEYGLCKKIEGPDISKNKVIIIDDGLNSAGYATHAIEAVESVGCTVLAVVVLINFEKKEYRELVQKGYVVDHLFTLEELGLCPPLTQLQPDLFSLAWTHETVNTSPYTAAKSSPVFSEDFIYVGSDQGFLVCLDKKGNVIWTFTIDPCSHGIHQTPVVVAEAVFISAYDGCLYKLDKKTGKLLWKTKASSYCGASPIYDPETKYIFVGLENSTLKGTMAAFDSENGKLVWEFNTSSHVASRAALLDELVIFGSNDGFVYACNKKTGALTWKYHCQAEIKGRITVDGHHCYVTSFDGHIYAFDRDGTVVWKKKLGNRLFSAALCIQDSVIVGSYSGQITSLDKKTGAVNWYFMTSGPIQSYPQLLNGTILFGSHDQHVYSIEATTGALNWKYKTKDKVTSSPAYANGLLVVSGNDGTLYGFTTHD